MTCRECAFWGVMCKKDDGEKVIISPGHYAASNKARGGQLHKGGCYRYRNRKSNRKFPGDAQACRLFEKNENPPPVVRQMGVDK